MQSVWLGTTLMMYPLGQFFGSPILGALSDQVGRKKILLISIALMSLFYLISALAIAWHALWLLIASRFLTGCCEGNIGIARAMAANMTSINQHKSMGLINAMAALGYVIGPLLGGVLADPTLVAWFNYSIPFYMACLLSLILFALTGFCLVETAKQTQPLITLQQINMITRVKRLCQHQTLKALIIINTLAAISADLFYEFYPAYMAGLWHANSMTIALYTVLLASIMFIGSGWGSRLLSRIYSDQHIIMFCSLLMAIALLIFLLFPPQWLVILLFVAIASAIALISTNLSVQVANASDPSIQGEVFGTLWGLRMLFDGMISFIGGFLIIISFSLPFVFAALAALVSAVFYHQKFNNQLRQNTK